LFHRSRNRGGGWRNNEHRIARENLSGRLVHCAFARGGTSVARKETAPDDRRRRSHLCRHDNYGRRHCDLRQFDDRRERFPDEECAAELARLLRRERSRCCPKPREASRQRERGWAGSMKSNLKRSEIYLDYNATTPMCDAAREAMEPYFSTNFGNASSIH